MKLVEKRNPNLIQCTNCASVLEVEKGDLKWTHCEMNDYYVTCPNCGKTIWIKSNEHWDNIWREQNQIKAL